MKRVFLILSVVLAVCFLFLSCDSRTDIVACTVSFDLGDESLEKIKDITVEKGKTIGAPYVPARTGYVFDGWYDGTIPFNFGTDRVTGNLNLTAKWTLTTVLNFAFPADALNVAEIKLEIAGQEIRFDNGDMEAYEEVGNYRVFTKTVSGLKAGKNSYGVITYDDWGDALKGSYSNSVMVYPGRTSFIVVPTEEFTSTNPEISVSDPKVDSSRNLTALVTITSSIPDVSFGYRIDDGEYQKYTEPFRAASGSTITAYTDGYNGSDLWLIYESYKPYTISVSALGTEGPAGGIIFYDAGKVITSTYIDSSENEVKYTWRYLEAAAVDAGKAKYAKSGVFFDTTHAEIGYGRYNTSMLLAQKKENEKDTAADKASGYTTEVDGVTYNDWFLPSLDELKALYDFYSSHKNLLKFDDSSGGQYWSSTSSSDNSNMALGRNFINDNLTQVYDRVNVYSVRAIRAI